MIRIKDTSPLKVKDIPFGEFFRHDGDLCQIVDGKREGGYVSIIVYSEDGSVDFTQIPPNEPVSPLNVEIVVL